MSTHGATGQNKVENLKPIKMAEISLQKMFAIELTGAMENIEG